MKNITFSIILLFGFFGYAQVSIDNSRTPAQLVQNVLVGNGVTPFNISFNGSAANATQIKEQAAQFLTNFNGNNFGIDEGLVLTTGKSRFVTTAPPNAPFANPPTSPTDPQWISDEANGPDSDLASLSQQTINNSVILEFDFVATGSELNFEFVFASKEYPEYVPTGGGGGINDSFGFFLSGPGLVGNGSPAFINGARNIALIPNTNIPVAIANVNNGYNNNGINPQNNQYYYNNTTIGLNPNTSTVPTIRYDGFTSVLSANAILQCGETYHIKLALGNASDKAYDSAVFLKNFRIKPLEILANGYSSENNPDFKICPGTPTSLSTGLNPTGLVFEWTLDTDVIPGETGPNLNLPANADSGIYGVTVTSTTGCALGSATFNLEYYPDPLGNPVNINLCTTSSAPYSFGDIRQSAALLQGTNPLYYDIRYFYTQAEAESLIPGAGISIAELSDYFLNGSSVDIFVRLEEQVDTACITVKKFTLTATAQPSGTFSYPNSPFCKTLTSGSIQTTVTPGGTYTSSNANLVVDASTGAIDISASTAGSYTVNYNLPASGNCPAFSVLNIPVAITQTPAAPTIASTMDFCQGVTASLNPTGVSGATFLWYTALTGGTGSATAPANITASPGQNTYFVSQVNGCEGPRASVVVNVFAAPTAPVTLNQVFCEGDTSAVALTTQNGETNLLWYTTLTGGTGSSVAPIPNTALAATTIYYVTQTINQCESPRASLQVLVNAKPSAPLVSSATIGFCQNDIVPSNALSNLVTGINLNWYTTLLGGVGTSVEPIVNTANFGNTQFYVSQTLNGCEGPRTLITSTVTAIPLAPTFTTPAASYCQGQNASLIVNADPGATLLWYSNLTGGIGSATAPNITATAGNATYYVSQITSCEGPRTAISVVVNATPSAPQISPISYCENSTSAVPLTTTGGETNLLWYADSNPTTVGSLNAPTPNTAISGVKNYYVTQTVGGCESSRSLLPVTIYALPTAPLTAPLSYCQNELPAILSATASTGGTLIWYTSLTSVGQIAPPVVNTGTVTSTTVYVSQSVNGCEGGKSAIVITINPLPNVPAFSVVQPTCAVNTAEIKFTLVANLEYSINNGTTFQVSPNFANIPAGITYSLVVKNVTTGCKSSSVLAVINPAYVIPLPPVAASITQPTCTIPSGIIEVLSAGVGFSYSINGGATFQSSTIFPLLAPNATYSIIIKNDVTGCKSQPSAFIVNPIPANPVILIGTIIQPTCTIPTGSISIPSTAGLIYSINALDFQSSGNFSGLAPNTTYFITVKNIATGCISTSIPYIVNPAPTFPTLPLIIGSNICDGETISLTTAAVSGATYIWTGPDGFTASTQNITIPDATIVMSGSYNLIIKTGLDCPSPQATFNVQVSPIPEPKLPQDGYICYDPVTGLGGSYVLTTGLNENAYDFQWFDYATGTAVLIPNATSSSYTISTPGLYGVSVKNETTLCESQIITANVGSSSAPENIVAIPSNYFLEDQSVTVSVTPVGIYEYQLDNGAWQSSNLFTEVASGERTVRVRNECGEISTTTNLLSFSKYFTPNGDGYNDDWNISELCGQPNAKIYIFDRYGKLLKEMSPCGTGWKGTFNSQTLPATDYWFTVYYQENNIDKIFKSHFALKR